MYKDQRRSILHVEDITERKKVSITKQLSRTEKASSFGRNFSEHFQVEYPKLKAILVQSFYIMASKKQNNIGRCKTQWKML